MDKSKFLSKVLGLYLLIISTSMYIHMSEIPKLLTGFTTFPALLLTIGFITLILGLLMVLSHNIWQWNWKVIITILAWVILLKGISIILFPHIMINITMFFVDNQYFQYGAYGFDFLLGAYLTYMGFRSEEN